MSPLRRGRKIQGCAQNVKREHLPPPCLVSSAIRLILSIAMTYELPHTIENHLGERIVFQRLLQDGKGGQMIFELFLQPGSTAVPIRLLQQDMELTVLKGQITYATEGHEKGLAGPGEKVSFTKGQTRRIGNAGEEDVHCYGSVRPAGNLIFCLSTLFDALKESRREKPEPFDGAFLLHRYRNEIALADLPRFVTALVIPVTYRVGKLIGRYKKFSEAPPPLTALMNI